MHGDLHGGNVLVDASGAARLTDFGFSLLLEATPYRFASNHGGGAIYFTAPELFDPERFGFTSSRPTFESDIFAFACIIVEVRAASPKNSHAMLHPHA